MNQKTHFGNLEGLDLPRMFHVWSSAQVDQRPAPIHGCCWRCHLLVENTHFELVVLKARQSYVLRVELFIMSHSKSV